MAWIKLDDQMVDHPKIDALSDEAFRWAHRGLSYANRFLTNGRLLPAFSARVPAAIVNELTTTIVGQRSPVWDRDRDGTLRIHDFTKYQLSKADVERERRLSKARQAKWRKHNGVHNGVSHGVTNGGSHPVTNGVPSHPVPSRSKIPPKPPRRPQLSQFQLEQLDKHEAAVEAQKAAARARE